MPSKCMMHVKSQHPQFSTVNFWAYLFASCIAESNVVTRLTIHLQSAVACLSLLSWKWSWSWKYAAGHSWTMLKSVESFCQRFDEWQLDAIGRCLDKALLGKLAVQMCIELQMMSSNLHRRKQVSNRTPIKVSIPEDSLSGWWYTYPAERIWVPQLGWLINYSQ